MGIKIDTSLDGDLDTYAHAHVAQEHGLTLTKLEALSQLLTLPSCSVGVYDMGQETLDTGMLLVLKHLTAEHRVLGGSEPLDIVRRMAEQAPHRTSYRAREYVAAANCELSRIETILNCRRYEQAVTQECGEIESGSTVIGMTAGSTPPAGVRVTQRIGRVSGNSRVVGYDGTK